MATGLYLSRRRIGNGTRSSDQPRRFGSDGASDGGKAGHHVDPEDNEVEGVGGRSDADGRVVSATGERTTSANRRHAERFRTAVAERDQDGLGVGLWESKDRL